MASCYGDGNVGDKVCLGLLGEDKIQHIVPYEWSVEKWENMKNYPFMSTLTNCFRFKFKNDKGVSMEEKVWLEIDFFSSDEERLEGMQLMNNEIESGLSWPFEHIFCDYVSFSQYFMSHSAFMVKIVNIEDLSAELQVKMEELKL